MKTTNITTLEELQSEKIKLRSQIKQQEIVLKDHYKTLSTQINPALRVIGMLTGNKLFNSISGNTEGGNSGWLATALKIITAVSAGGFILQRSKQNLLKTMLAYAINQGVQYVQKKDLTEHFEKIKQWLSKHDEVEENDDSVDEQTAAI